MASVAPVCIKYRKTHPEAIPPKESLTFYHGYELFTCRQENLPPQRNSLIDVGLQLMVPSGYIPRISPNLNLSVYKNIAVDPRPLVGRNGQKFHVQMRNFSSQNCIIRKGKPIVGLMVLHSVVPKDIEFHLEETRSPESSEEEEDWDGTRGREEKRSHNRSTFEIEIVREPPDVVATYRGSPHPLARFFQKDN